MSEREEILKALTATLEAALAGVQFSRNETRADDISAGAANASLFDGAPREVQALLGGGYAIEHAAELELTVSEVDQVFRDQRFSDLIDAVHDAVTSDLTLGGLVDHMEVEALSDPLEAGIEGMAGVKAGLVPIVFWYVGSRATG
ncbi:MAG: hypothetical protein P1U84_12175 [Parvibaculaceae bacterium]|nr:hypothetical protein [Parvibaculaceae bacterium]